MNEGCNGGWPILSGFFSESFGLPAEEDAGYMGSTSNLPCSDYEGVTPVVKIKKRGSGYIGGYYGGATELSIMRELRARGPVSGDFNVPMTFSMYNGGIFSEDHGVAL